MLEYRSALDGHLEAGRFGAPTDDAHLTLRERPLGALVQLAGWRDSFADAAAIVLRRLGFAGIGDFASAQTAGDAIAFRVAPERILFELPSPAAWAEVTADIDRAVTPTLDLGHARTVVRIAGAQAASLMARLVPIDFDDAMFGPDDFAQTGLHSVAVLVHRRRQAAPCYDIYIPSSFAVTVWETITANAASFGYQVDGS